MHMNKHGLVVVMCMWLKQAHTRPQCNGILHHLEELPVLRHINLLSIIILIFAWWIFIIAALNRLNLMPMVMSPIALAQTRTHEACHCIN